MTKKLLKIDLMKDALTAATTLMDEMITQQKVFKDYEKEWDKEKNKKNEEDKTQLALPLPLVLLVALITATKACYGDPPGYTRKTFKDFIEKFPETIDHLGLLMFPITLDDNHELEKIKEAYKGTSAESCLDDVVGNAKIHGNMTVKEYEELLDKIDGKMKH